MKRNIGRLEAQLLAYAQMRGWTTVRTGDLRKPLRLSADQERKLFSRLARAGMIARVWRGLYLVPPRLPLGGKWSPDEGLALATLMAARGGRYQICGLNAFNRYGFDEQMPNRVYAYNNRLWGDRRIGSVSLTLIKVADARLGATEKVATSESGPPAIYSSRWIEDGSFTRLQNVTVGYTFNVPGNILSGTKARAYLSGDNLLLFTPYTGYDPEVFVDAGLASRGIDYLTYPRARTYTFGLRLQF